MQDTALTDSPLTAQDVARGIGRLFWQHKSACITEMMLPGGRRADIVSVAEDGRITIVEIKVSVADLRGDAKWRDYLPWCDEFYWGIPAGFDASLLEEDCFSPQMSGLIIADRFDAAILRPPAEDKLSPARRKRATLLFARAAAGRQMRVADPFLETRG